MRLKIKLEEAKVAAKENEESLKNKLYKNAPNLAEVAKQGILENNC